LPKKLFIILIKDPSKIRNRIEQNKIEMLKPMVLPYGLVVMDAHEFDLDIMVLAIYIGIGVMGNVVLQLPKVNIASQKVQGVRQYGINMLVFRKGIMSCIMHDVKSDCGQIYTQ